MVMMGVAGLLAFSLVSTTQNSMKMQNNTKIGADLDHYVSLVALQMADPTQCGNLLNLAGAPPSLGSASGAQVQVNLIAGSLPANPPGVNYVSAIIQNATTNGNPVVAGTASVPVQLVLTFQKTQQNFTGAPVVTRSIPFTATTSPFGAPPSNALVTQCQVSNSSNTEALACASRGGIWNVANNPPCSTSPSLSCVILGGTYNPAATPPCSGAVNAQPQTQGSGQTSTTNNYGPYSASRGPAAPSLGSSGATKYFCECSGWVSSLNKFIMPNGAQFGKVSSNVTTSSTILSGSCDNGTPPPGNNNSPLPPNEIGYQYQYSCVPFTLQGP